MLHYLRFLALEIVGPYARQDADFLKDESMAH